MRVGMLRWMGLKAVAGALLCGGLSMLAPAAPLISTTVAAVPGATTDYSANLPATGNPSRIAPGPDGNLWFTDAGRPAAIGRVTTSGVITEFSAGLQSNSEPFGITTGPEGDLWFTDRGRQSAIGRLAPEGTITEFSAGLPAESFLWSDIVLGADGNLWFVDRGNLGAVGHVNPSSGQITEFVDNKYPSAIALGPEGDLWVTGAPGGFTGLIARFTSSGEGTVFTAGLEEGSYPLAIAPGTDGNLWFVDDGPTKAVGRITPAGEITEFSTGLSDKSWILGIAPGPDGNMWFADSGAKAVGRITPDGAITEYPAGFNPVFGPDSVAPGSDGEVWFSGESGGIKPILGKVETGAPPALVSPPVLSGGVRVGAQESCGAGSWSSWTGLQPSSTLLAFDGYRWLIDGSPVASGQFFVPTLAERGHLLSCQETVTYPWPFLVSAVGTSPSSAIVSPPPPKIAAVRESAHAWRAGSTLAAISFDRVRAAHRPPVGTTFSFSLSEPAAVRFAFLRRYVGHRINGRCEVGHRRRVRRHPCSRRLTAGTIVFAGHSGTDRVAFQGWVSRSKRLAPGSYTLMITATDAARQRSAPRSIGFTVLG